MITGIGLDIVELNRIEGINNRTSKFRERILTQQELNYYDKLSAYRQLEYLAGRFASKEAFSKAMGTGIGECCSFQDIMVLRNDVGKPELYFKGELVNGFISITHTKTVAAAQVILQK